MKRESKQAKESKRNLLNQRKQTKQTKQTRQRKQPKQQKQTQQERQNGKGAVGLCLVKGLAVAFAITCIVFIGFGILLTYTKLSEDCLPMVVLGCTALSAAAAGFDWGGCMGSKGFFWGLLAGAMYTVVLFLIVELANGVEFALSGLMILLVALAGGGIGGILGVNRFS